MKMCTQGLLTLELLNIDTWVNSKQVFTMTDDSSQSMRHRHAIFSNPQNIRAMQNLIFANKVYDIDKRTAAI